MKRHSTLGMSGVTLLACAALGGSAGAQQKVLKEQLVGAWTLVSIDETAKGTKRQELGANPKGTLILDASGRYAEVRSKLDRPKFAANGVMGTTADIVRDTPAAEFGEAARAFVAFFGAWSVNEADNTLIRNLEGALIPNSEGRQSKSAISLVGDELRLSSTSASGEKSDAVYKR
jgi:hypothetical protein